MSRHVGIIHFENKCDVCAHAFWRNEGVGEQNRSFHFEKYNYSDTFSTAFMRNKGVNS